MSSLSTSFILRWLDALRSYEAKACDNEKKMKEAGEAVVLIV
jgi:hypothetical protein